MFSDSNPSLRFSFPLQRIQAYDRIIHNVFWVRDRELDIIQNLFIRESTTQQPSKYIHKLQTISK